MVTSESRILADCLNYLRGCLYHLGRVTMNTIIDFETRKAIPFGPELIKKAEMLMAAAKEHGSIRIGRDMFLYDNKVLIEKQKALPSRDISKGNDYTTAPFFTVATGTAIGNSVSPCHTPCHTPQEVIELADQGVIKAVIAKK